MFWPGFNFKVMLCLLKLLEIVQSPVFSENLYRIDIISSLNICQNLTVKPSGSEVLFMGRFSTTNPLSLGSYWQFISLVETHPFHICHQMGHVFKKLLQDSVSERILIEIFYIYVKLSFMLIFLPWIQNQYYNKEVLLFLAMFAIFYLLHYYFQSTTFLKLLFDFIVFFFVTEISHPHFLYSYFFGIALNLFLMLEGKCLAFLYSLLLYYDKHILNL